MSRGSQIRSVEPITELVSPSRPWAALSPDMVSEISSRLCDATDFVRFHAVCRPWRESAPSLAAIRNRFLPWPLALHEDLLVHVPLNFGCLSPWTTSPYHGYDGDLLPHASSSGDKNWVATEDGTAAWFLTLRPEPTMEDLLTGATRVLPPFPGEISWRMEKSHGIVYSDGTIFVYSVVSDDFTAAILRPGDVAWTIAEKRLYFGKSCHHSSAAYHDGKILVCLSLQFWFVLMPDFEGNGAAGGGRLEMRSGARNNAIKHEYSYIFESGNELMWATVWSKQNRNYGGSRYDLTSTPWVTLHALVEENISGKMRLVARDGQSLKDRVLFLGSPASFTVNAKHLGGCVYFVFKSCVYKYNLINGVAELMERVRGGWGSDEAPVWLQPHPAIAPIDEIEEKLKATRKNKNKKQFSTN